MASKWREQEEGTPIVPYTKCTAIRDFSGEQPHDLPFRVGDQLTIIEPCNVVFWYFAENERGKRGVIPINFVKVNSQPSSQSAVVPSSSISPPRLSKESHSHFSSPPLPPKPKEERPPLPHKPPASSIVSQRMLPIVPKRPGKSTPLQISKPPGRKVDIDSRPPAPLPPEANEHHTGTNNPAVPFSQRKYHTQKEFVEKSGWFTRSLETVLCKKMLGCDLLALTNTKCGVYIFIHTSEEHLRYVGKSRNAYQEIVQLFNRLFEKPENKLSPIEMELKYNYPDASCWHFRLYSVSHPELLDCEYTEKIMKHRTLQPEGLNKELKFTSKEHFYKFAEYYANLMREKAAKPSKPVHLLALSQR